MTEELLRKRLFLGRALRAFISAVGYKYGTRSSYLAINAMSDWTPDEIKRHYSGGLWISKKQGKSSNDEKMKGNQSINQEDEDSIIPAIDEEEILKVLSNIDENSSFPGYKEIIRELKSFTSRRMKRENSKRRDLNIDDLFKEPIKEDYLLSNQIPSNNPNYIPPELRSLGIKKLGDKKRPMSKKLADRIFKSSGLKFATNLIKSFTSKFRSPSKKVPEHIAALEQEEVYSEQGETSHHHASEQRIDDQYEVDLNTVAQDEPSANKPTTNGQPMPVPEVQPSDNIPQNGIRHEDKDNLKAEIEQLRQRINSLVEMIKKQLEQYQIKSHNQELTSQSDPNLAAPTDDTEQRFLPKDKRIEAQIAELQQNLQIFKKCSDNLEKLAKLYDLNPSEPPSINQQVPNPSNDDSTPKSNYAVNDYAYNFLGKLPDQVFVDHRVSNCFFPPRDQGFCGSCYAFATIALYEWLYCIITGNKVAFSEQYVVDCGETVGLGGCSGGSYSEVSSFVEKFGLELRQNYPYTQIEDQCPYDNEHISKHPESMGYIRINGQSFVNIRPEHVDYYLTGGPIVAVLMTNSEFSEYGGGVSSLEDCNTEAFHAVLIIGSGREDGKDYWLIRNSNGVNWGERGYFKLNKQSPCLELDNFSILYLNAGSRYIKNDNEKYDENVIKDHYGSKFVPDYDGALRIRSQLTNLMTKLREIKGGQG